MAHNMWRIKRRYVLTSEFVWAKTYILLRNLSSTTKPSYYLVYDLVSILKNHLQPWNFIEQVKLLLLWKEQNKMYLSDLANKSTELDVLKIILISEKHKEVHTYLFLLWETWTSQTKFKGYSCNNRFIQFLKFNSQSKWLNKYCSIWG